MKKKFIVLGLAMFLFCGGLTVSALGASETIVLDETNNYTLNLEINPIGDATLDGKVNMKDWNKLYDHVSGNTQLTDYSLSCADVTEDGKVNMKDWNRLYSHVTGDDTLW